MTSPTHTTVPDAPSRADGGATDDPVIDEPAIDGTTLDGVPAEADLDRMLPVAPIDLVHLRARLATRAASDGVLDVAYRTLETRLGELLLAATPAGLVRVAFESEGFDSVLQSLAEHLSPRVLESPERLDEPAREVDEYLSGSRRHFDLVLDRSLSRGFRGDVQHFLGGIGYGHTVTYRDIAIEIGNPGAVRAVGSACATNPLPIVVPCHRVLRTDGSLGGYLGGLEAKRTLLALESATR